MALYPRIEKRLGTLRFYNITLSTYPFVILCFPLLNALAALGAPGYAINTLLFVYFCLWSFCGFVWSESESALRECSSELTTGFLQRV